MNTSLTHKTPKLICSTTKPQSLLQDNSQKINFTVFASQLLHRVNELVIVRFSINNLIFRQKETQIKINII